METFEGCETDIDCVEVLVYPYVSSRNTVNLAIIPSTDVWSWSLTVNQLLLDELALRSPFDIARDLELHGRLEEQRVLVSTRWYSTDTVVNSCCRLPTQHSWRNVDGAGLDS
jgi:hypothetical protein